MKTILATLLFASLSISGFAQDSPNVSIAAKGDDVRQVLHSLFDQAKKSYVLEPNVRFVLFLSLRDMEFEEALQLVCKNANLKYEIQNGVYFVNQAKSVLKEQPKTAPKTDTTPLKSDPTNKPETTTKPESTVKTDTTGTTANKTAKPEVKSETKSSSNIAVTPVKTSNASPAPRPEALKRIVTTKLSKVDIRALFTELGRQTDVKIQVGQDVPAYKLDAFLKSTSLKFALDSICNAASLNYTLTGNTVTISTKNRR